MYKLNLGSSYTNMKRTFRAGELFTAEELGADLNETDDNGTRYFVPATSDEVAQVESAQVEPIPVKQDSTEEAEPEQEITPKATGGSKVVIGKKKATEPATTVVPDSDSDSITI